MDEATSINGVKNMIYDIIEAPDSADFEGSGHGTQRGYVSSTKSRFSVNIMCRG